MMGEYLSEVFLKTVGMNVTEEKVKKGIEKCGELLEMRLEAVSTQAGKFLYFFEGKDENAADDNMPFREMIDLWDVLKEFADDEKYQDYEIVKVCRVLYSIYRQAGNK